MFDNRNLWILFVCQLISVSTTMILVTLAGVIGSSLAANPALATLPVSLMVVGTALATVPAAMLMKRIGRRNGFALAAAFGAAGLAIGGQAIAQHSFAGLCAALVMVGMSVAFTQQYRFAAAESVMPRHVGRAISLVLFGSIGGAMLGPEIVDLTRHWSPRAEYTGTLYALSGALSAAALLLLAGFRNPVDGTSAEALAPGRALRVVITQPLYLVAVSGGVVAYGVMAFVMTATPVSMHVIDGHGMPHTADVVRSHVVAMYAPSLLSGLLIERLGVRRMMALGTLCMLATAVIGLRGQQVMHYWFALVMLGVGWNFLYIGATTLLTRCYRTSERFRAQAVNDFSVFAISAAGSLLAGTAIHLLGWNSLMLTVIAPLLLMLLALFWIRGFHARPLGARENAQRSQ